MNMENKAISGFMGRTMRLLEHALDFRSANQAVIAGNMANIETPGYKPQKATFNQALKQAVENNQASNPGGTGLRKTHEKHLPDSTHMERSYIIETYDSGPDGGGLDKQMANLAQNNLLFEASATLLSRRFQMLKEVIGSGRR